MMNTCIAVVDATRARLFSLERDSMRELRDLVNPTRRRTPHELFSDSRPGTGRTGGRQFGFDDHRDAHIDEIDEVFARSIVTDLRAVLGEIGARRLVLCASPRMLGMLRPMIETLATGQLEIEEVARDLVKLPPARLRAHLSRIGALPTMPSRQVSR
jgi:protein required for attachment to host cells